MKVCIGIRFINGDDEYSAYSKIIEWDLPLPLKGDNIDVDDIEKKFGALKYPSKKDKQAIQGNLFSYVDKTFYLSGKAHCHLNFSDSEETIRRT